MASSSSKTSGRSPLCLKFVVVGGGIAGDYLFSMGTPRVIFLNIMFSRARNCFYSPEGWSQRYCFGEMEWKGNGSYLSLVIHFACTHPSLLKSFGETGGPIRWVVVSIGLKRNPYSRPICRAPPNMTRLLYRWGLGPVLNKKSIKCERLVCVNGSSSHFLCTPQPRDSSHYDT